MKKWLTIIVGIILLIVLIVIVWEWVYLNTITKEEVFILPQNFKGIVVLAYDQENGIEDKLEDGKLIYRVPHSGIIKLKRKEITTLSESWYYFEDEKGKRTMLAYCFPPCEAMRNNPDKFFAYGKSNGSVKNGGEQIEFTSFLVGTFEDTDSLNKVDENLNLFELIKKRR